MKKIISALILLALTSPGAFADTKKSKKKSAHSTQTTKSNSNFESNTIVESHHASSRDIKMGASLGLGMLDGNFGFGAGFRLGTPINLGDITLLVGGETGIYRFSYTGGSVIVIPISGTAQYDFKMIGEIKPYVRARLGFDIVIIKYDSINSLLLAPGVSTTSTKIKLPFVAAPGVSFSDDKYFAELQLGTVAGAFLLMPTFGMNF